MSTESQLVGEWLKSISFVNERGETFATINSAFINDRGETIAVITANLGVVESRQQAEDALKILRWRAP